MAQETKKNRERKDEGEPRRFTFSLSTAGLVSLSVVTVAALAWVFILGVLVGRGYKPEQAVPQLAEIMPRPEAESPAPKGDDGVLRPEELEFFDAVKKQPAQASGPKVATNPEAVAKAKAADAQARADAKAKAADAQARAEAQTKPKVKAAAPAKQAEAKAERQAKALAEQITGGATGKAQTQAASMPPGAGEGARFDYVYQTASLRKRSSADEFAQRLRGKGFKTSIEQAQTDSGTWFRVLLHHTGTPESTRAIKDMLREMGVQKPIMRSKDPI